MSVPRPAMLVAIVTAPGRPACATMYAFLLVIAGVQDGKNLALRFVDLEERRKILRLGEVALLHRDFRKRVARCSTSSIGCADENRLSARAAIVDELQDRLYFSSASDKLHRARQRGSSLIGRHFDTRRDW